jgi:hypothetical protein
MVSAMWRNNHYLHEHGERDETRVSVNKVSTMRHTYLYKYGEHNVTPDSIPCKHGGRYVTQHSLFL